jgi:hypothetical protein
VPALGVEHIYWEATICFAEVKLWTSERAAREARAIHARLSGTTGISTGAAVLDIAARVRAAATTARTGAAGAAAQALPWRTAAGTVDARHALTGITARTAVVRIATGIYANATTEMAALARAGAAGALFLLEVAVDRQTGLTAACWKGCG